MAEASIRRNPDFRRLWIGESITFFGGAVRGIARFGIPLGGWLGEWIGMRTCLFIASAGVLAATAFIQFSSLGNRTT
jgi:predicted MFS family arabinose efflux permease